MKVFLVILLGGAASAMAATAEVPNLPSTGGAGELVLRMFGAVFLLAAALYGVVHFLKRVKLQSSGAAPKLRLLESRAVAARQSLSVVAYEHKRYLISSGPQGVCLLTELPEGDVLSENASAAPASQNFGQILMAALQQKGFSNQ